MPDQTAVFVSALVARYGDQAYPYALEQVSRATGSGMQESALSWAKIADGIASLPRTAPPIAPVLIEDDGRYPDSSDTSAVRQLLYVSIATRHHGEETLAEILRSSLDNNVLYGVTGILWSDGERFIQALEGPIASVEETYARILVDDRHHSLAIIYDHLVAKRGFGSWAMCHRRSYETDDDYDQKIRRALFDAPSPVRATIAAFIGEADGRTVMVTSSPPCSLSD
jgi:hypothetical protein